MSRALSRDEQRILERFEGRHLAELERELEELRDEIRRGERVAELAREARGFDPAPARRCSCTAYCSSWPRCPGGGQASGPGGGRALIGPIARIRGARRAALRRRYGWAALRVLRRGLRRALAEHRELQLAQPPIGARSYSTTTEQLGEAYADSLKALRKRWPRLDLADPRAELGREW